MRTRNGEYAGELCDSDISDAIWLSLPFTARLNMLGCQIYFEMPLDFRPDGGGATVFDAGDIAYWPGAGALCIFFGPTPLSGDDGRPVSRYPLIKIGRVIGDCSSMEDAGDRQTITIDRSF
jgi:hypothetical protein